MGFRNILIANESILKIKLENLIVIQPCKDEVSIPITDINTIVIDNLDTTLSTRLLEHFSQNNVTVIICDKSHMPIGIYNGINVHSRSVKVIQKQINLEEDKKELLWKHIVKGKIKNQAYLLYETYGNSDEFNKLKKYYTEVEPLDKTNREAHSAKVYFNKLFGSTFSRSNEDILINSALNYGYAIVRAHIARLCVAYGLNTTIGIFHKSEYNQFNLCDDLIEPFRPIIDKHCIEVMKGSKFFMSHHRNRIIQIVDHKVVYKNRSMYLSNALEDYVASYSMFLDNKNIKDIYIVKLTDFSVELED